MPKASEKCIRRCYGIRDLISSIGRIEHQKITSYGGRRRQRHRAVAMDDSEDLRDQDARLSGVFVG